MSTVKAILLTETYILQANRARCNRFQVDPTCTICGEEPEDKLHFILRCKSLSGNRDVHMKINLYFQLYENDAAEGNILSNEQSLFQIILDCTHKLLEDDTLFPQLSTLCNDIELLDDSFLFQPTCK